MTKDEDKKMDNKDEEIFSCPICGQYMSRSTTKCKNCGQEVEWDEVDEEIRYEEIKERKRTLAVKEKEALIGLKQKIELKGEKVDTLKKQLEQAELEKLEREKERDEMLKKSPEYQIQTLESIREKLTRRISKLDFKLNEKETLIAQLIEQNENNDRIISELNSKSESLSKDLKKKSVQAGLFGIAFIILFDIYILTQMKILGLLESWGALAMIILTIITILFVIFQNNLLSRIKKSRKLTEKGTKQKKEKGKIDKIKEA